MSIDYISKPDTATQVKKMIKHFLQDSEQFIRQIGQTAQHDDTWFTDLQQAVKDEYTLPFEVVALDGEELDSLVSLIRSPFHTMLKQRLLDGFESAYLPIADGMVKEALRYSHENAPFRELLGRKCGLCHGPSLDRHRVESDLYVVKRQGNIYCTYLKPTNTEDGTAYIPTGYGFPKRFRSCFLSEKKSLTGAFLFDELDPV